MIEIFSFKIYLHPTLVHFPIALFISSLILDTVSLIFKKDNLHQAAVCSYILAVVFAPITAYAGLWEAARLSLHHPLLDKHQLFGLMIMYFSFVSVILIPLSRRFSPKVSRTLFFILALSMSVLVVLAGYYGGRMVYEYGVGTNA
jgi:uncharacterized membrane protein